MDKEFAVSLGPEITIEPTTRENVEARCEYQNKREFEDEMLRRQRVMQSGMLKQLPEIFKK